MIKCSICKKKTANKRYTNVTSVYSPKAYAIANCGSCDHFFTSPAPSAKELDDIYTNKYSYDAHSLIEGEKVMRAARYARYVASLEGVKSALEVGCMHGLLLIELKRLQLRVAGVELDPGAVKHCKKIGLNVVQSSVEDYLQKAGNKHDVIIMSHVIEHIADPTKQLTELRKRMSKDGRLVLITPNSSALTRKVTGKFWGYWQVPVHINHFNRRSMSELLDRAGLQMEEVRYYGADSLFFLSTLANILGSKDNTKELSPIKRAVVKVATIVLRPWYFIGKEDMLVVARPK